MCSMMDFYIVLVNVGFIKKRINKGVMVKGL